MTGFAGATAGPVDPWAYHCVTWLPAGAGLSGLGRVAQGQKDQGTTEARISLIHWWGEWQGDTCQGLSDSGAPQKERDAPEGCGVWGGVCGHQ